MRDRTNVVPARGLVNAREANQQQRIGNGVSSGQITAGEAARAEGRQAKINQQVRTDRQVHGGALNQQQRKGVQREQNGAGQQIYLGTHNGNVQPQVREQVQPQPQVRPQVQPQPQAQQQQVRPQQEQQVRPQGQPRQEAPRGRVSRGVRVGMGARGDRRRATACSLKCGCASG